MALTKSLGNTILFGKLTVKPVITNMPDICISLILYVYILSHMVLTKFEDWGVRISKLCFLDTQIP